MNVSTVKHVFATVRKVALQDLKEKGTFKVHGICDLAMKETRTDQTRKRGATEELDTNARPARKIKAKVNKELVQLMAQEREGR